mgnify:CR=1 FL=1
MNTLEYSNYPVPKREYKVLARCFTYNHSSYIEDALNGFAIQQTSFPFVCLIVDDASTDGEQDVIKGWIERECVMEQAEIIDIPTSNVVIVPHKRNSSCIFAVYLLKQNLYRYRDEKMNHVKPWREKCTYEAVCEGDDYWIDPLKLQKQVDFLDSNNNYVLVGGNAEIRTSNNDYLKLFSSEETKDVTPTDIINKWSFPTAGILYRSSISQYIPNIKGAPQGDIVIQLTCASQGYCRFDKDVVCVYRWLVPGSSTERVRKSQIDFYLKSYSMWVELNEYFGGAYNEAIRKKLKEIKRKIIREKIYNLIPGLQTLRSFYRHLRGY